MGFGLTGKERMGVQGTPVRTQGRFCPQVKGSVLGRSAVSSSPRPAALSKSCRVEMCGSVPPCQGLRWYWWSLPPYSCLCLVCCFPCAAT